MLVSETVERAHGQDPRVHYPTWYSLRLDTRDHPTLITYFSIVHGLYGMVVYTLGRATRCLSLPMTFLIGYMLHVGYEIKDMYTTYGVRTDHPMHEEDSMINTLWDQACYVFGFGLAHLLGGKIRAVWIVFTWLVLQVFGYFYGLG